MLSSGVIYTFEQFDVTDALINQYMIINSTTFSGTGLFMKYDGAQGGVEYRGEGSDRAQQDGSYFDPTFKTGYRAVLDFYMMYSTGAERESALNLVISACEAMRGNTTDYMNIRFTPQSGSNEQNIVDARILEAPSFDYVQGTLKSCRMLIGSERPYTVTSSGSGTTNVIVQGGGSGWTVPLTLPMTFVASGGGDLVTTNLGTVTGYPKVTLLGPITNPVILNVDTNEAIYLNTTLAAGDLWTIDLFERTIVSADGTNRISALDVENTTWFGVLPNTNTNWQLIGSATDSNTVLSVNVESYWG